jgi:PIN domain nuclease of toxin-antitoxin system
MTRAVLDASALVAAIRGEPGAETVVRAARADAAMSVVNLVEAATVLMRYGAGAEAFEICRTALPIRFVEMDIDLAARTAALFPATRPAGLSLGDRVCLALAGRLGVPALTADRAWATVPGPTGIDVRLIR